MGAIARLVLGIPVAATQPGRRGFRLDDPAATRRLEAVGSAFVTGYHAALVDDHPEALAGRLDSALPSELCGFAYEGAAMALAVLDTLTPWRRDRWEQFLAGLGGRHAYMVHVGAGWALARLGTRVRTKRGADPLLRWLIVDGLGFHDGFFHTARAVRARRVPAGLSGYAPRAFDQGLGRSLWFVEGASPEWVARAIDAFEPARQPDLWSGVGLAAAYAGGVGRSALATLAQRAGPDRLALAQGAAFAAKARERAGNPAPHTELACSILCGLSASDAAAITDSALAELPPDAPHDHAIAGSADPRGGLPNEPPDDDATPSAPVPAYETWRARVRAVLGAAWGEGSNHATAHAVGTTAPRLAQGEPGPRRP